MTQRMLPLYEGKMLHHYDHRWATYVNGAAADVTLSQKRDPAFAARTRYWVREDVVLDRLVERWTSEWLLGWRDICRSTDERTTISTVVGRGASPEGGVLLALPETESAERGSFLCASLNAYAFDFVARQKVGGTHLKFFTMKQLPILAPESLTSAPSWKGTMPLGTWIASRVLELTFTAYDMRPFAEDLGDTGEPFIWDPERRFLLRCELDAAFFHLYGIERDDVGYVMETFPIVKGKDLAAHGEFRTKLAILEMFDAMQRAIETGVPYRTILDPPPGQGPRHPEESL